MTQTRQATVAQSMLDSAGVRDAIDTLVEEVRSASSGITDVRPADDELKVAYNDLLERAAAPRGRALLYPTIGSGIGNGALVELMDGSVKWDMITGIGVHFFGHSDPELIRAAIVGSLEDTVRHGNLQSNFSPVEFTELLVELASRNSRLRNVFLSTSGAMANEHALKACQQKRGGAPRVIAFRDCFMGRSTTMAQIGDSPANRDGIPLNTLVDYMPFYDLADATDMGEPAYIEASVARLKALIDRYPGQHACFIFELIQGEGGFNVASRAWLEALMKCCRENEIPVWDDEIQTFGRTTSMFAYEHFDLGEYVDVICIGKMTQACATLFTPEMNPKPGLLSGTFTGDPVGFRVGTRMLERLRDGDFYGADGRIVRNHEAFTRQVRGLAEKHPSWFPAVRRVPEQPSVPDIVGGLGGMMRFTPFGGAKKPVLQACRACYDEGVILFYCGHGPFHLRMLPPLGVFDEQDWPRVFECVERGLSRVAQGEE